MFYPEPPEIPSLVALESIELDMVGRHRVQDSGVGMTSTASFSGSSGSRPLPERLATHNFSVVELIPARDKPVFVHCAHISISVEPMLMDGFRGAALQKYNGAVPFSAIETAAGRLHLADALPFGDPGSQVLGRLESCFVGIFSGNLNPEELSDLVEGLTWGRAQG